MNEMGILEIMYMYVSEPLEQTGAQKMGINQQCNSKLDLNQSVSHCCEDNLTAESDLSL